ncbi:MAG: Hpt domain-containing protein [Clostridia bacterium]|nr:Hpt domain-containing protein [Clostridia bacterium]
MSETNIRYDLQGLADEIGVEVRDIVKLFLSYFSEMRDEIEAMRDCLSRGDWHMLKRTVHNIKGVSANLNVHDVFKEAEKLDMLLKYSKMDDVPTCVNKITKLIDNAEIEIKRFFNEKGFCL